MNPGTGETSTPKVFICYRREDTAAHAGRLYDSMVNRFGEGNVFMDVDMAPGVDFVERISEVVSSCQVLIVVMGPNWARVKDDDGEVRIADPDDFVRLEVETALKRHEVTAIPCLVSEARMPKREDLPPELQPLARRNALELSNSRWGYDVERLHTALDELLAGETETRETMAPPTPAPEPATPVAAATPTPVPAAAPTPPVAAMPDPPQTARPATALPASAPSGARLILEGVLVAAIAAYLGRWLFNPIPSPNDDAAAIASVILRRGGTWALTGAALAVWLAARTNRTGLFRFAMIGLLVGAIGGAIGGAIWAVPTIGHDPNLDHVWEKGSDLALAHRIEIAGLAATGGFIGGLLGWLWGEHRLGVGLVAGAGGGVAIQLIFNQSSWDPASTAAKVFSFGLAAAVIAAFALTALVALDARRARAPAPARGP